MKHFANDDFLPGSYNFSQEKPYKKRKRDDEDGSGCVLGFDIASLYGSSESLAEKTAILERRQRRLRNLSSLKKCNHYPAAADDDFIFFQHHYIFEVIKEREHYSLLL